MAELERKVGQQAMEIDFLKRALQHVEEQRLLRATNAARLLRQIEEEVKAGTGLSVSRMCEVSGFSRAGYYRFLDPEKPAGADMDLRDQIQKMALEWPSYGSRRIARNWRPGLGGQS